MNKVAIASKDGKHLIGAFGSIGFFRIYTIEDGRVVQEELRELYKDEAGSAVPDISRKIDAPGNMPFNLSVFDPGKEKHMKMARSISDCDTVIARKMCANARDSILQFKMKPFETSFSKFDRAIEKYLSGELEDEKST